MSAHAETVSRADSASVLETFDTIKGYGYDSGTAYRQTARVHSISEDSVETTVFNRAMYRLHRLRILADLQRASMYLAPQAE